MLTTRDMPARINHFKDFLGDQNYLGAFFKLNTGGLAISATEGLGTAAATSSLFVMTAGGFADVRVTGVMKYISPTTSGSEELGLIARVQQLDNTNQYYYARLQAGFARITKTVASVNTNLSSSAYVLAQNTLVTITLTVVGTQITAKFSATGGSPSDLTLSATDNAITGVGSSGARCTSSAWYVRSMRTEQL